MAHHWLMGPLLPWQLFPNNIVGYTPPLTQLLRSGKWGLPVGKGYRDYGGLQTKTALKLERAGLAFLTRNTKDVVVWSYPTQLHFDFILGQWWDTYRQYKLYQFKGCG